MSQSLCWRPVPKPPQPAVVPDDVVGALRSRYWDGLQPRHQPADLSERDIAWLEGVRDAGLAGATELIEAICAHGT